MAEFVRLRYITEPFKSADRTLLFYTPRSDPALPAGFLLLLQQLGEKEPREIYLHDYPCISVSGAIRVYARNCLIQTAGLETAGLLLTDEGDQLRFDWNCDCQLWLEFADLVDGLVSFGNGHQYLRSNSPEDAQVIVSKGEYFDSEFH